MEVYKSGKAAFQVGNNLNLFDWTYVDNVVHAHIVAAERIEVSVPFDQLDLRLTPVDQDVPRRLLPTSKFRPDSLLAQEKELNPTFVNDATPDPALLAGRNRYDQYFNGQMHPSEISVAGQAFFITNGAPTPFWDFGRAVWSEYDGYEAKRVIQLPVGFALGIAAIGESIMAVLRRPAPNMTRGKVTYSTVNRYYNIEKVSPSFRPCS
jgi:sterol-4alpha-carboxylate 3-dehydrogenase (decarboxylating)